MPDHAHVERIKEGVKVWNRWRLAEPDTRPDLSQANLKDANLAGVDLSRAALWQTDLSGANLAEANLVGADLYGARLCRTNLAGARLDEADLSSTDLTRANLSGAGLAQANLVHANLHGTDLRGADLDWADLSEADLFGGMAEGADFHAADLIRTNLTNANLAGANLTEARLVETKLRGADLSGCHVYGTSVWKANLEGATQTDLVVTPSDEPEVTVDDLEVAQLVYLLLDNEKIRNFIDSLTSKAVLILGSFSPPERKEVLDAVKRKLREEGYAPILFDVDGPDSQDATTTVTTLARLSRFVVIDLTDPRSSPYEIASFAREVPTVIRPLVWDEYREFGMFADLQRNYEWVLDTFRYEGLEHLVASFNEEVVRPAEAMVKVLRARLQP